LIVGNHRVDFVDTKPAIVFDVIVIHGFQNVQDRVSGSVYLMDLVSGRHMVVYSIIV